MEIFKKVFVSTPSNPGSWMHEVSTGNTTNVSLNENLNKVFGCLELHQIFKIDTCFGDF